MIEIHPKLRKKHLLCSSSDTWESEVQGCWIGNNGIMLGGALGNEYVQLLLQLWIPTRLVALTHIYIVGLFSRTG